MPNHFFDSEQAQQEQLDFIYEMITGKIVAKGESRTETELEEDAPLYGISWG